MLYNNNGLILLHARFGSGTSKNKLPSSHQECVGKFGDQRGNWHADQPIAEFCNRKAAYIETHSTTTNENGLVTIEVGGGSVQTGNFASIEWGNGTYFIKTETDPEGGSNYTISGTSQLLSVPYALYAASSKFQGRITIYLTGDITDTEAAAKVAAEAGPNTENIYIVDTTVLTSLNIPGIEYLINLQVRNNTSLQALAINDVKSINAELNVVSIDPSFNLSLAGCTDISGKFTLDLKSDFAMPSLTKINASISLSAANLNFPALQSINSTSASFNATGSIDLPVVSVLKGDNAQTAAINDSRFSYIAPQVSLGIADASTHALYFSKCTNINLPSLTQVAEINISDCVNVNLPSLIQVGKLFLTNSSSNLVPHTLQLALPALVSGNVYIDYTSYLTSASFPSFNSGILSVSDCFGLTSLTIPNFSTGTLSVMNSDALPSLTAAGFTSGILNVQGCAALSSISLPSLTTLYFPVATFNDGIITTRITGNTNLASLSFPSLTFLDNSESPYPTFLLKSNKLTVSTVDAILHQLLTVAPVYGVDLLQYPNSAHPSAQGQIDKQTLISQGKNIITD